MSPFVRTICVVVLAAGLMVHSTGCGSREATPDTKSPEVAVSPTVSSAKESDSTPQRAVVGQPVSISNERDRLHQAFKDTAVWEQAPEGELRPPDTTITGKNVVKMFETIAGADLTGGLWDRVRFTDASGKMLKFEAVLTTKLGVIRVELFPDKAPNHVRNFVALAMAGYYDGLPFHRSVREESTEKLLSYLEAGCPRGQGDIGLGSIGYWLKPEIDDKLTHEPGTLGAYHSDDANDSAACKFYFVLNKAPWMDGNYTIFGRITQGLDVATTINKKPVLEEAPFDRPREPVIIDRVEIITSAP